MKPIRFSAGLLAALILGFNSPVQAELPVTVTFGAALHTFDDGHNLDSEVLPVAAVEYRFDSNWAGQLAYSWGEAEADDSGEDVDIENWQLGIAYYFAPGESLHPYLGFGGGELSKEFSNSDKAQTQANVGAGFRYYLGDHWNWQADARLLHSFSDSDNDIALTVAIAYDFADPPAPVVPEAVPEADSDGDGVVDSLDECPDTPAGVQVDERGCPVPVIRIASIKLKVNFAFDSHVVEEHYFQNLEELADFLKRFADIQIELEGHTDTTTWACPNAVPKPCARCWSMSTASPPGGCCRGATASRGRWPATTPKRGVPRTAGWSPPWNWNTKNSRSAGRLNSSVVVLCLSFTGGFRQ